MIRGAFVAALYIAGALASACSSGDVGSAPGTGGGGTGNGGAAVTSGAGGDPGPTSGPGGGDGGGDVGPDACLGAALGDGTYCGASLSPPGDEDTLYQCQGGKAVKKTKCTAGCAPQPPGTPDACVPDSGRIPPGKGVWIARFGETAPPAAEVAAKAEELGVGFVLVKSGEDYTLLDDNLDAATVGEFTSRDIAVYAWHLVTPGDVESKAKLVADRANEAGAKGVVVVAEDAWETSVGPADAEKLCKAIRADLDADRELGFSSLGWIENHPDFPYQAFDSHCADMHLPRIDWAHWGLTPDEGLQKATQGAANLGLTAPLWPVQGNQEGAPATDGLAAFFAAAGPHASLFRWPDPGDAARLAQMEALAWAN